ncbi:ketoacyl-ACP synthase III [soil metagenome]
MEKSIGIAAAAVTLPNRRCDIQSLFQEEKTPFTPEIASRLGIEQVTLCHDEVGSAMALDACQKALERAECDAAQLDVIVDYSILPQEYLVPAWNMSNKLQHELGAKKAFTVGFSGGGATNLLTALSSAVAMLAANEKFTSALLVAADITIPGNRVLNPGQPVSVLGDSAGAVVLRKEASGSLIIDTELNSEGSYHDVCYIPGGALAQPDDPAFYRMELDLGRYESAAKAERLRTMLETLLERNGIGRDEISFALYPNLSQKDQEEFIEATGFSASQINTENRKWHGHLQGTDLVLNYLSMLEEGAVAKGRYFLAASHGMGFLAGVSLLQL